MRRTRTSRSALLAGLMALGLVAGGGIAVAAAESDRATTSTSGALSSTGTVIFVRDHNLWMARGDGSGQVQLTDDGTEDAPYSSPSFADDTGRFAAAYGRGRWGATHFAAWESDGELVDVWKPAPLFTTPTHGSLLWENDPSDPVLSPDGRRIAYMQSRAVSISGRITAEVFSGFSSVRGSGDLFEIVNASSPAWLTSTKALMSRWSIGFHAVGSGTTMDLAPWFGNDTIVGVEEGELGELSDPAISPNGRMVAFEARSGDALVFARTASDPRSSNPPPPTFVCQRHQDGSPVPEGFLSHYDGVDFGPDNDSAIFEQYGDTYRIDRISACDGTTTVTRILAGGTDADWSPLAYAPPTGSQPTPTPTASPTASPTVSPTATPTVSPTVSPTASPTVSPTASPTASPTVSPTPPTVKPKVAMKGKAKLKGKPRVGKVLRVKLNRTDPRKTTKKYTWFRNGKKIKGAVKANYRLTRVDRGKRITVKVALRAPGHRQLVVRSTAVRVRR